VKTTGRYDRVHEATHPGPDLPNIRLPGRIETVVAAVADPNPVEGEKLKRQRVAVNVARDPLEQEYRRHRISTAAYLAGRAYQQVMEAAHIGGGKADLDAPIGAGDHEAMVARRFDRAQLAVDLDANIRASLGAWSAMILRGALVDGHAIREMAERNRRGSKDSIAAVWIEFREALECLGDHYNGRAWNWA
jgi:hypothetical protein